MTTTSHAPHYPALNGLRGMSIILVVLHHCRFQLEAIPWIGDFNREFPLFTDGQFGVQVFFVISGFLITHLLLLEQQRSGQISIRGFYIRRTLRIFPAYYFLLLVYFVLSALQVFELSWNSWLTSAVCMGCTLEAHILVGYCPALSARSHLEYAHTHRMPQ